MFAVIRTGGKQHRVAENDRIVVERLDGEPGELIAFDDILMLGDEGSAAADRRHGAGRRPGVRPGAGADARPVS